MTGVHDKFLSMEGPGKSVATMHQLLLWLGIFEIVSAFATIQMFTGSSGRQVRRCIPCIECAFVRALFS